MTFEQEFNSRVDAFLSQSGLSPTALGLRAVGDPNLIHQIRAGRSPSLRTADRVLAYIAAWERSAGGARAPPARSRVPESPRRARRTREDRAMTRKPKKKRTRPMTRLLRVSEVQALTGLARSTIYAWSAQGRFPPAIRLSPRAARWVEADVKQWLRDQVAQGQRDAEAAAR